MQPLNPLPQFLAQQDFPLFGVAGHAYRVRTDAGSTVRGWVAADRYEPMNAVRNRFYFCHGHSLSTYREFGYSVFSGPDLETVLRDEYLLVGGLTNAEVGDLLVWRNAYPNNVVHPDHSAILTFLGPIPGPRDRAVRHAAAQEIRQALENESQVSTKNGQGPVQTQSVRQVCGIYGNVYSVYRRR